MSDPATIIAGGLFSAILTVIGFLCKRLLESLDRLQSDFQKHLVDDARIAQSIQDLVPQLTKLESKLDKVTEKE